MRRITRKSRTVCSPTQAMLRQQLEETDRRLRRILVMLATAGGESARTLREELVFLGLKQFRLDLMLRREGLCTDVLKGCLRISRALEAGSFGPLDLTNAGLDESH